MNAIKRANDLFRNIHRTELELLGKCIKKTESFDLLDITTIWCLAFLTFQWNMFLSCQQKEMYILTADIYTITVMFSSLT